MKTTDTVTWGEVKALVEQSITACQEWERICNSWMDLHYKVIGMTFWQRVMFVLFEGPRSNREAKP